MRTFPVHTFKIFLLLLLFCCSAYAQTTREYNKQFETLKYKLKLGWFPIGSGEVNIDYNATWKGTPCYKVTAYTETLGIGNWLGSLDDHYTSMISKEKLKPIYNKKNVINGNKRWEQWSKFDYDSMSVDVRVIDHNKDEPNRAWHITLQQNTQDVLSTYLFFKSYNWINTPIGDSVMISTFYEKKLYFVGVQYMGQEIIEFNNRNVGVHRLHLLMPEHKNLKKERPVIIWVTANKNQYPLLIQTKLPFLGKAKVILINLNGNNPNF